MRKLFTTMFIILFTIGLIRIGVGREEPITLPGIINLFSTLKFEWVNLLNEVHSISLSWQDLILSVNLGSINISNILNIIIDLLHLLVSPFTVLFAILIDIVYNIVQIFNVIVYILGFYTPVV